MSIPSTSESEKSSLNVPDILADFFLKKIEMGSYSDDSSHKHKGKKKKSKHKKGKYKKSKHRHRSRSSSKEYQKKETNEDMSSSDEINIKRLKKIKSLRLNSKMNPALQSATKTVGDVTMAKRDPVCNSSSKNLVYYGPSLELLLSGVESNSLNVESASASGKIIEVHDKNNCLKDSELKCFDANIKLNSPSKKEDVTKNHFIPEQFLNNSNKLKECENNDVFAKSDENSIKCNKVDCNDSEVVLKKNINESVVTTEANNELFNLCKNDADKSIKSCVANYNKSSDICDKDILIHLNVSKKCEDCSNFCDLNDSNLLNVIRKNDSDAINMPERKEEKHTSFNENDVESFIKENVMDVLKNTNETTEKIKAEKCKRKSHSQSQSKNNSKKIREKSRSSSRESHTKTKRKRSRSISHEKSKLQSPSRNFSRTKYRQSHSRSPRRSRSRSHSKCNRHSRSRSRKRNYSRSRSHSVSRSRYRSNSKSHRNNRSSRSRSKCRKPSRSKEMSRSRSRSKPKEETGTKINQAKILETARRNVLKMMKDGTLPEGLNIESMKKEQLISMHAGGKSVQELTEFCQRLSQKENNEDDNTDETSDNDTGFIHHPFKVKEPAMIKLNIKNAVQLPIKSHSQKIAELSSQFPVSSGNHHKQKELEWIPVIPDSPNTETKSVDKKIAAIQNSASVSLVENSVSSSSVQSQTPISYPCPKQILNVPITSVPPILPPPVPPSIFIPSVNTSMTALLAPSQIEMQYTMPKNQSMMVPNISVTPPMPAISTSVFKSTKNIDISTIVTKRFQALTKLQQDPNDPDALGTLRNAQQDIQDWVQSQQVPGLFTGSTDAKVLSAAELCGPKYYSKFRKDFFTNAPPVSEGKGMSLLKKMGWNPGEGLGKNKEGSLEPLVLDIKMDKKGLVSEGENSKKGLVNSFTKELQGKHPVSALMELCSKRKWKPPLYTCIMDIGPPHKKLFCFKVEVNGIEYQPVNPCANKKVAKADAAIICLQALNVFPKNSI